MYKEIIVYCPKCNKRETYYYLSLIDYATNKLSDYSVCPKCGTETIFREE